MRTYDEGKIYREGISAVIIGRPNVGKSSLLNSLLREDRAIVTPIPGTTRDVIEEIVNLRGIPLKIMDTAGLRHARDAVEVEGVRRTRDRLAQADLVIWVVDGSESLDPRRPGHSPAGSRERRPSLPSIRMTFPGASTPDDLAERTPPGSR